MAFKVISRSLSRAHWYGELNSALEEAERLLFLLEADGSFTAESGRLCIRVAAIRSEVEMLNRIMLSEDRIVGVPWSQAGRITGSSR